MIELRIEKNDSEQRLDRFLKKLFKKTTLSNIYKMIRKDIKINGKRGKENTTLHEGDVLNFYMAQEVFDSMRQEKRIIKVTKQFKVVYEDDDMIIVSKPFGLLTHGDKNEKKNHLTNQVVNYLIQGGHYTFAMETAGIEKEISFKGYEDIQAGIVKWPMSVIRLDGSDPKRLADLADKILTLWRAYSDPKVGILAETDGEPHNTITPIARRRGDLYELDLVLRCNITSEEHPLGVFHPHADKHHIKKENIGLIEVMGLAVLPSRLKKELTDLAQAIVDGRDISKDETLAKHAPWVEELKKQYVFSEGNALDIILQETGKVFAAVLEDAGVYKCTPEGRAAFLEFVNLVNKK